MVSCDGTLYGLEGVEVWKTIRQIGIGFLVAGGIVSMVYTIKLGIVVTENTRHIAIIDSTFVSWQLKHDHEVDSMVNLMVANQDTIKTLLRGDW